MNAADAPEAVKAENGDIDEDAAEAGDRINEHVARTCIASYDGELVNFVERAINGCKNDWVEDLGVFWEANWVETFNKASTAVAEGAKEEKMGKFAHDFV